MILSSHCDETRTHAIEPLVQSAIRMHPASQDVLRAAWDSVQIFFEESDSGILREPEAALLLYARALAACNQTDLAGEIARLAPCATALLPHLSVDRLSLNAIRALAAGALRPVPESSLSRGLVILLDGSRFHRDARFEMDFAMFPVLRSLTQTALELLAMTEERGLLLFRGWSVSGESDAMRSERRAFAESVVERETTAIQRPELMWVD